MATNSKVSKIKGSYFDNDHTVAYVIYDIESEQEFHGDPLLICFKIFVHDKFIVLPHVPCHEDVMYFRGHNCCVQFVQVICDIVCMRKPAFTASYRWYLVAHNGNRYDHLFIVNSLRMYSKHWYVCSQLSTKSKLISCVYINDEKPTITLSFLDTYKFLNFPLKKFVDEKGVGKESVDVQEDFTVDKILHDENVLKYCCQDVRVLCNLALNLIPDYFISMRNVLYLSRRGMYLYYSQADCAYQMVLQSLKNPQYCLTGDTYECYKQSYYGARVDSAIYGMCVEMPMKVYDIASQYPANMNNLYPCGQPFFPLDDKVPHLSFDVLKDKPHDLLPFIAKCALYKPECRDYYGLCPLHVQVNKETAGDVKGGSIFFVSSGYIRGTYTSITLSVLLQDGWKIVKMHDVICWPQWCEDFKSFYQHWFNIKQSTDNANERWCSKIILNASIGKFAQKLYSPDEMNSKPGHIAWFCLSYSLRQHYMLKCIVNPETPIFAMDTDSIFIPADVILPDKILDKKILGDWHNITGEVEKFFDKIYVLAKKMYLCMSDNIPVKSAHKGIKYLTKDMCDKMLNGEILPHTLSQPYKKVEFDGKHYHVSHSAFFDNIRNVKIVVPPFRMKDEHGYYQIKFIRMN